MKSFSIALLLLFIGLKLTNYIDWSWWWILSPFWIGLAMIPFLAVFFVVAAELIERVKNNKK